MHSSTRVPRMMAAAAFAAMGSAAACSPKADSPADTLLTAAADTFPSQEGMIDVPGGKVWYRKIGNGPGVPLLAMHGGPGGTSCRFEVLAPLGSK